MDARLTQQSAQLAWPREHAAAKQAYVQYISLPPPRRLARMAPFTPLGKDGMLSDRAYTLGTLENWKRKFKWDERVALADDIALKQEEEDFIRWQIKEQLRRKRRRLAAADTQQLMAMSLLVDPETHLPRPMKEVEPRYLELANAMLKESAATERLDLGDITSRVQVQGTGAGGSIEHTHTHVADKEQLAELRELVEKLPEHRLEDIIDITPEPRAVRAPSRAREMSEAELLGNGANDAPPDLYDKG